MARTNAKEPLVEAARNLFSIKGYDGTSVDEIAEAIHLSKYYLERLFKREMGITPHQYYTQALTQITGRPVRERILYSTALRKAIRLQAHAEINKNV